MNEAPAIMANTSLFTGAMDLFEKQVAIHPDSPAVVFKQSILTYRELDEKANRIASHLKNECQVTGQDIVGICLNRSENMIVAILGVLKTGAAYLPIDVSLPANRVEFMLQDANACTLITESDFIFNVPSFTGSILALDIQLDFLEPAPEWVSPLCHPQQRAYIIYTSGSTGKPKGVVIEHQSLADYIVTITQYLSITAEDAVLQQSSVSFDISIEEIFPILCTGGRLVVTESNKDFFTLINDIGNNKVSILSVTTELVKLINKSPELLNKELSSLRIIISGGEILHPSYIDSIYNKIELYNSYGPTESTVCVTYYRVDRLEKNVASVPIGKPLRNRAVLILDRHLKPVPVGVAGELFIGGIGLAKEYLNQEALTAEKFIDNPYQRGQRLYRSGDMGKWLPDGNIEFVGRVDSQVKLRGFRIELGEIEKVLMSYQQVEDGIVLLRENEIGSRFLVAYLVTKEAPSMADLKRYLAISLPEYMIPSYFSILDSFPCNINGKIDLSALPTPWKEEAGQGTYQEPETATQRGIAGIWYTLLRKEKIGVNSNFFELGGNSLTAVEVITKVYQALNKELQLKDIFSFPFLGDLAQYVDSLPDKLYQPIPVALPASRYAGTPAQQRMYLLQAFDAKSVAYNMPGLFVITGPFNADRFQKAIDLLIARHESFRTTFGIAGNSVCQFIRDPFVLDIPVYHVAEKELERFMRTLVRPFDLQQLPLLRLALIYTDAGNTLLFFDVHHIIFDGVSYNLLLEEVAEAYVQLSLKPARLQYKDYAVWFQQRIAGGAMEEGRRYWLTKMSGKLPVTEIKTDFTRPAVQTFNGDQVSLQLPGTLTQAIKQTAAGSDCTLYMFMMAAFALMLHKYTGQQDVIIGTPAAGRNHPDMERIIGLFVNTMVIRLRITPEESWDEWLQSVKQVVLEAIEHQDYQFDSLLEELNVPRDISRTPLFQILFTYNEYRHVPAPPAEEAGSVGFGYYKHGMASSKFDLTFNVTDNGETIFINLLYNTDLYKASTINRLAGYFFQLVEKLAGGIAGQSIGELQVLTGEQKAAQLSRSNEASSPRATPSTTICSLFDEHRILREHQEVLVAGGHRFSAREAHEAAVKIAQFIVSHTRSDQQPIVALYLSPGHYTYLSILGALKAGAAFLPVDVASPPGRLEYILRDANAAMLITDQPVAGKIAFDRLIVHTDELELQANEGTAGVALPVVQADQPAYIIYTSGSTGMPKGVTITHAAVTNYVQWFTAMVNLQPADKTILLSSYAFDLGYTALFPAMCTGCSIHLVDKTSYLQPDKLFAYLQQEAITYIKTTPSLFSLFVNDGGKGLADCSRLRLVVLGGESLRYRDVAALYTHTSSVQVLNHYGPTESTIGCISMFVPEEELYSQKYGCILGKPISGAEVLILDPWQQLLPIGAIGEICVGGPGLAIGYLNQPALTAEKFIVHPFRPSARLYKTGDLGRWTEEGTVEFLGRVDNQVKIRGNRVEVREIEVALQELESVRQVFVMPWQSGPDDQKLIAYVVTDDPDNRDIALLRETLAGKLPDYMIPAAFVFLEALPVTENGKINVQQLPGPQLIREQAILPLQTVTQQQLGATWQDLLGVGLADLSPAANFFEAGGNSLTAARLANNIQRTFQVDFALRDVFTHPTIELQAARIQELAYKEYTPIGKAPSADFYPLSNAQLRLWVLNEISNAGIAYNIPISFRFNGKFNANAFSRAFQALVKRYEILRTVFVQTPEGPRQQILPAEGLEVVVDMHKPAEGALQQMAADAIGRKFNLSQWPLFHIDIYENEPDDYLLSVVFHHIITDGWSGSVIYRELLYWYNCYDNDYSYHPQPLPVQYKDYLTWHAGLIAKEGALKKFWIDKFSGIDLSPLQLRADHPRPDIKTFNGKTIFFSIDKLTRKRLDEVLHNNGHTLFTGLLTAANVLLYAYAGQNSFIIGTPFAGRNHADLENQIGFFINMLPLHIAIRDEDSFEQLLARFNTGLMEAFQHQHYPFDLLVNDLRVPAHPGRSPLFDVTVALQNYAQAGLIRKQQKQTAGEHDQVSLSPVMIDYPGSKFDLAFTFLEKGEELTGSIEYNTDLFLESRIRRMAGHLVVLLEKLVQEPAMPIQHIHYLSQQEQAQLLHTFNDVKWKNVPFENIISLFEEKVSQWPDKVAVVAKGASLSYGHLQAFSGQWASVLNRKYGIKQGAVVALWMTPSPEMITILLGIVKTGAAYVLMDPVLDIHEQAHWLIEAGATVIMVSQQFLELANSASSLPVINEEEARQALNNKMIDHSLAVLGPPAVATVVYRETGNTGQMRAVKHAEVVMMARAAGTFAVHNTTVLKPAGMTASDQCLFELWSVLLNGATLVLEEDQEKAVNAQYILTDTLHQLIPDGFSQLTHMDTLIVAEGALSPVAVEMLRQQKTGRKIFTVNRVMDHTLAFSLWQTIGEDYTTAMVAGDMAPAAVCLLDETNKLIPEGVPGRICVDADDYAQHTLQGGETIMDHPYLPGRRLVKTATHGQWLPNGSLQYFGANDHRATIHGYTVDIAETERVLAKQTGVSHAIVRVKTTDKGEQSLIAFVMAAREENLDPAGLRTGLSGILPEYLIPAVIVPLPRWPLTRLGRLDEKALQEIMATIETGKQAGTPATATEKKLAIIRAEVLEIPVDQVGIYDNFFDMAGHSLLAIRLIARINALFGINIDVQQVFNHPTIAQLAKLIDNAQGGVITRIPALPVQPYYAVSPGQLRMWILSNFKRFSRSYTIIDNFYIKGSLNVEAFKKAVRDLVARHESLRTVFIMQPNGDLTQQIIPPKKNGPTVTLMDASGEETDLQTLLTTVYGKIGKSKFDLAKGPLFKAWLIKRTEEEYFFTIRMHHIISDAWSVEVIIKDVVSLYNHHASGGDYPLRPLAIQYKDFAAWHHEQLTTGSFAKSREFWLDYLRGDLPVLRLFKDQKPADEANLEKSFTSYINGELSENIRDYCATGNTTFFTFFLTAFQLMLAKYSGLQDIIVGVPSSLRTKYDLEEQVGIYINSLPVRTQLQVEESFQALLERTKENVLRCMQHQEYPFEQMVMDLNRSLTGEGTPVFNVMYSFNAQAFNTEKLEIPGLSISRFYPDMGAVGAKFDLLFFASDRDGQFSFLWLYNGSLLTEEQVKRMAHTFHQFIVAIIKEPAMELSGLIAH